jgi:hypothetical protein
MSRVRYYHIALSHIALFRLSLLTERNILALAQDIFSPDNTHSLKRSIDISVGDSLVTVWVTVPVNHTPPN